jgi:hypothetical protein
MKHILLLLLLMPLCCFAQLKVRGKIVNAADGKPVPDASVFFNNATIGTKSAQDGSFVLRGVRPGQYDMVVSVVGYERYNLPIMVNDDLALPDIKITAKIMMLKAVTIGTAQRWKKLKEFKEQFFGRSAFATQCKLKNPEVLELYYSNRGIKLTGQSDEFLEIENNALGYKLKYLLNSFVLDKDEQQVAYEGSVLFEEKAGTPADSLRWKKNRQTVYNGSTTHFLREVLAGNTEQDYLVRNYCINWKDETNGQLVYDTLRATDYVHRTERRGVFAMSNDDKIEIFYFKPRYSPGYGFVDRNKRPGTRVATITFIDKYLLFDSNGTILNPLGARFDQAWGVTRVAQLLPIDYRPPVDKL